VIKPVLQDDAFLSDVALAKTSPDSLHVWWLGQSGYLIQWQTHHLLIDPYLSDSLTKKYASTSKPHVRMTGHVIAPERLNFVEVVTSSHNHTDHLDGETLIPLLEVNPGLKVIVSSANLDFAAQRLLVPPERLTPIRTDGSPVHAGPFIFHALPSAHEVLEPDEQGDHRFIGIIVQAGPWTIYHSGDGIPYDGLAQRLRKWKIDLALLPINGRDPARGVAGNFNGEEAATLARDIGAGLVIPCHYEMFAFNTASPETFIQKARMLKQPHRILRCGERLDLQAG
jgi:L-ascorbate metabolism protein UlaG (beta-lactamase superfamily)